MKRKNIISLSVALAFLALSATGLLLYLKQKSHAAEVIHTIFGLLFIGFAIFHILNNWMSLKAYTKPTRGGGLVRKEFVVASAIFGVVLVGAGFNLPPFEPIAEAGRYFAPQRKRPETLSFNKTETNQAAKGRPLEIFIEMGEGVQLPAVVVWTEDSAHHFVESLFVPAQIASVPPGEDPREAIAEGELEMAGFKAETFFGGQPGPARLAANYPETTPAGNFLIRTKTSAQGKYRVVLEIRDKGRTERHTAEIDGGRAGVFMFTSGGKALVVRALVQAG